MPYEAPVDDILFALKTVASDRAASGIDAETLRAVVEEAGKFAGEVLAPLNPIGDINPAYLEVGRVVTPPGWRDAYSQFAASGWSALPCPEEYGGQNLPQTLAMSVCEIWNSANLAFGLCPLLTQGAIDALHAVGSPELKKRFLPRMISGEWTGTMNLTEPHAGTDLGAITTRAEKQADGTYRISGTKIFITDGDHDLTENIIHMVLARLPDAPPGTKGISLFLVPKRLVDADGSLGEHNDVVCAGLEHKLGIHGSPTAVMKYGEKGGAVGYLVGEENRGLAAMFIMMNAARLAVGMQGVAVAERALQKATRYAKDRRQGRTLRGPQTGMVPIVEHPDVRRNLLTMRALTQAARCICLATARELDISRRDRSAAERRAAADRAALLTPVAKAFATDTACEVASLALQVHGGMGFIEETGIAQLYRDARILPIYEGTNGIQAIDLATRKLPLGSGAVVRSLLREFDATVRELRSINRDELGRMGQRLSTVVVALHEATDWMLDAVEATPNLALASATPYLRLFALAAGGSYLARGAIVAINDGGPVPMAHLGLARFFAENIAVAAPGLAAAITSGAGSVLSQPAEFISA